MASNAKKILVVEDEKPMAHALKLKLTHEGFDVTEVFDGESAISEMGKQEFSLVLLDLVMPKVDGFGVLESIKKKDANVSVFVLSNLSQEEDEKKAKALGAEEFFIKSNTPITDIVERVKATLTS